MINIININMIQTMIKHGKDRPKNSIVRERANGLSPGLSSKMLLCDCYSVFIKNSMQL